MSRNTSISIIAFAGDEQQKTTQQYAPFFISMNNNAIAFIVYEAWKIMKT